MRSLRATVTALLVLAVAACGPAAPKFQGSDVTGIGYGRDFRLTDHTGKPLDIAGLALFVEEERGAPFTVRSWLPLAGA